MHSKYQKFSKETNDESGLPAVDTHTSQLEKSRNRRWRIVAASSLCFAGVSLVILVILTLMLLKQTVTEQNDINSSFDGGEKQIVRQNEAGQTMHASIEGNFVQYHIRTYMSENTWIIDDFNLNLQIMKSATDTAAVCYVSRLNISEAMHPSKARLEAPEIKQNYHGVYTPDAHPVIDRSFLGAPGRKLCEGVDVYWLHPMEDVVDLTGLESNMNSTFLDDPNDHATSRRTKRNIRACHSSCCWLVCCCDVHHFKWEATEYFTCKHVCQKCTSAYKQKIQKIC